MWGEEERANSSLSVKDHSVVLSYCLGLNHDREQSKLPACTSEAKDQVRSLNDSLVTGQELNTPWLEARAKWKFSHKKGLFRNLVLTKEWMENSASEAAWEIFGLHFSLSKCKEHFTDQVRSLSFILQNCWKKCPGMKVETLSVNGNSKYEKETHPCFSNTCYEMQISGYLDYIFQPFPALISTNMWKLSWIYFNALRDLVEQTTQLWALPWRTKGETNMELKLSTSVRKFRNSLQLKITYDTFHLGELVSINFSVLKAC